MTYEEESYVLDTLKELKDKIRSPNFKQFVKDTHENNLMLKQIIKVLNYWISNSNQENEHDFGRNILANMISNLFNDIGIFKNGNTK